MHELSALVNPSLTVVVLTLNESENIERCLRSVSWARRKVVVDSGSSDSTRATARRLGAEVFEHRQAGPFDIAEQRNWACANIGLLTDWVLFLDADEVITEALARRITTAISTTDHDSYELTPKYLFQGQWMRWSMGYPNWHARLVHAQGPRFTGGVWEDFDDKSRTGRIAEPYLHYGNSKGFGDWLARHDRYSSHDAKSIANFLKSGDDGDFGTSRRIRARVIAARLWRLRPVLRFLYMYIGRAGFLDGTKALRFCLRYALYEYMTVEKVAEIRLRETGRPL